jgi:hypothetical protein
MGVPRLTPLLTSPYAWHRSCDESTLPVCRRVVSTNPTTKAPTADRERNQQDEYYASSLATGLRRKAVAPLTQDDERVYSAR